MAGRFTAPQRIEGRRSSRDTTDDIFRGLSLAGQLFGLRQAHLTRKEQASQNRLSNEQEAVELKRTAELENKKFRLEQRKQLGVERQRAFDRGEGPPGEIKTEGTKPVDKMNYHVVNAEWEKDMKELMGASAVKILLPAKNRERDLVNRGTDQHELFKEWVLGQEARGPVLVEALNKEMEKTAKEIKDSGVAPKVTFMGMPKMEFLQNMITSVEGQKGPEDKPMFNHFASALYPAGAAYEKQVLEAQNRQELLKSFGKKEGKTLAQITAETKAREEAKLAVTGPGEVAKLGREKAETLRKEGAAKLETQRKDIAAMIKSSESAQLGVGIIDPKANRQGIADKRMATAMDMTVRFLKAGGKIETLNIPPDKLVERIGIERMAPFMYKTREEVKTDLANEHIDKEQAATVLIQMAPTLYKTPEEVHKDAEDEHISIKQARTILEQLWPKRFLK